MSACNELRPDGISASAVVLLGAYIGKGAILEDQVRVGPYACVLGEEDDSSSHGAIVKAQATIGANATVLPGVTVGQHAVVRPGAVVTRSVPPFAIVEGSPAKIVGYTTTSMLSSPRQHRPSGNPQGEASMSKVRGVALHQLRLVEDLRGNLCAGEFERDIPFRPKRYFVVFDVPSAETRGEHAHLKCAQFLVCVKGSCSVIADDSVNREEFLLDTPAVGLMIPPLVWSMQYKHTSDTVLLVFASEFYDADDYIREYDGFLQSVRGIGKR